MPRRKGPCCRALRARRRVGRCSGAGPSKARRRRRRPPECCGYPFPRSLDAEIADSDVRRVHYGDAHVMLLEVSILRSSMSTCWTVVGVRPRLRHWRSKSGCAGPADGGSGPMDPKSPYNDMGSGEGPAPQGMKWPTCTTAAPQAPHRPFNSNLNPNHFFRIEFLRVEGDDFQRHWKEWYPSMTAPVKPVKDIVRGPALGPNFSSSGRIRLFTIRSRRAEQLSAPTRTRKCGLK